METQKRKKIRVKLNAEFYDKSVIDEALRDFKEICDGEIINKEFEIELEQKAELDTPLKEEFCNYVLGLMKNKT